MKEYQFTFKINQPSNEKLKNMLLHVSKTFPKIHFHFKTRFYEILS